MAQRVHLAWLVLLLGGCGGPPIGGAVPKANTNKMAIGAAAAATALTLANPNAAGRRPESAGEQKPKKLNKTGENVPSGVLDRLDSGDPDGAEQPCDAAPQRPDEKPAGEANPGMVPKVVNENRETRERERREKCAEQADPEPKREAEPEAEQ